MSFTKYMFYCMSVSSLVFALFFPTKEILALTGAPGYLIWIYDSTMRREEKADVKEEQAEE